MIHFGPAGLGPVKTALTQLDIYAKKSFRACEIAFTYGPYIKSETDARAIGQHAKKHAISLSIHAPYFVNLASEDEIKRKASIQRILDCAKIGSWLGAKTIVFHPGYYQDDKEKTYETVRDSVKELLAQVKKNKWNIELAPETMGKVNVFGSIEEISRLVKDTGSSFCIDFAHVLARDKHVDYNRIETAFPGKSWHVHFSGIIYGEKGEKSHKTTTKAEWTDLLSNLPKSKEIIIINESPTLIEDSEMGLAVYKRLK